jgi:hypothetical protein
MITGYSAGEALKHMWPWLTEEKREQARKAIKIYNEGCDMPRIYSRRYPLPRKVFINE